MQIYKFRVLTLALFLTPIFLQAQAKFETFTLFSADTGIPVQKSTMGALGEDRQLRYSFRLTTAVEPPEGERFEGVTYAAGVIAAEATQPGTAQTVFKTNDEHPAGSSYYANMAADAPLLAGADQLVDHFKYIQTLPKRFYPKDAIPERLVDFKPSSLYPADTAPAPTYLDANAFINAGGKISYVAAKTFTLNPEKDAWDPYLMAYDREMEIYKFKKVSLFPDEDASYYTNAIKGGKVLQLSAPQNGLLSIFGGLKYKKREDKDRSEQHEFQLLSFDQAGNVVHQEVIQSEEALQLTTSYALAKGPYLNGNTRAASSFIFEAQGQPDGANAALRRLFWVDSQTGKLHKTIDFSLPSVHAVNAGIIDLPHSNFATIVYFHTFSKNRGFTFVSLDKNTAEIVDIQNFDNAFIDRGGVPPSKIITAPKFIIDAVYGQDGHYLLQVVLQQSDETADLGKWLLDYDSNEGKLRHAITTPPNRRHVLLDQAASRIFFYTQDGDGAKARPALWAFGKGYDGLTNLLAADQELAGNFRYNVNYNAKLKMLFFMTRGVDGQGLYLHRLILESQPAIK